MSSILDSLSRKQISEESLIDSELLESSELSQYSPVLPSSNIINDINILRDKHLGSYVNTFWYYAVIVLIVLDMGLFVVSNLFNNVSVNIEMIMLYDKNTIAFNLLSSVKDFWESEAYLLAVLMAVFCVFYPYFKLLCLVYIWVKPMKQKNRKRLLNILDQCSKLSFMNMFVIVYMIISFNTVINDEIASTIGVNIEINIKPDIGLILYTIGNIISILISQIFIYFEVNHGNNDVDVHGITKFKRKDSSVLLVNAKMVNNYYLFNHYYNIERVSRINNRDSNLSDLLVLHPWYKHKFPLFWKLPCNSYTNAFNRIFVSILVLVNVYLYVQYIVIQPIMFSIDNNQFKSPNIISIMTNISHVSPFLFMICFLTIIFAPVLFMICVIITWFIPMKHDMLKEVSSVIPIIMSWNCLDIFMFGIIVSSIELNNISQWIINENYSQLCGDNGFFHKYFGNKCFDISGALIFESYLMIGIVCSIWIAFGYIEYAVFKSNQSLQ